MEERGGEEKNTKDNGEWQRIKEGPERSRGLQESLCGFPKRLNCASDAGSFRFVSAEAERTRLDGRGLGRGDVPDYVILTKCRSGVPALQTWMAR